MTSTVSERPVRRCPKSGDLHRYPAFADYCPTGTRSSWPLVLIAVGVVAVARWGMGL